MRPSKSKRSSNLHGNAGGSATHHSSSIGGRPGTAPKRPQSPNTFMVGGNPSASASSGFNLKNGLASPFSLIHQQHSELIEPRSSGGPNLIGHSPLLPSSTAASSQQKPRAGSHKPSSASQKSRMRTSSPLTVPDKQSSHQGKVSQKHHHHHPSAMIYQPHATPIVNLTASGLGGLSSVPLN